MDVPAEAAVIVIAIAGGAVADVALGAVVREVTVVAIRAAAVDADDVRIVSG